MNDTTEIYNREPRTVILSGGIRSTTSQISETDRRELLSDVADRLTVRNPKALQFKNDLRKLLTKYKL